MRRTARPAHRRTVLHADWRTLVSGLHKAGFDVYSQIRVINDFGQTGQMAGIRRPQTHKPGGWAAGRCWLRGGATAPP